MNVNNLIGTYTVLNNYTLSTYIDRLKMKV